MGEKQIPAGKNYDQHDRTYASFILEAEENRDFWILYAGLVVLTGIREDWTQAEILDYLFESFHGMSPSEVCTTPEAVVEDMRLYKENQ